MCRGCSGRVRVVKLLVTSCLCPSSGDSWDTSWPGTMGNECGSPLTLERSFDWLTGKNPPDNSVSERTRGDYDIQRQQIGRGIHQPYKAPAANWVQCGPVSRAWRHPANVHFNDRLASVLGQHVFGKKSYIRSFTKKPKTTHNKNK